MPDSISYYFCAILCIKSCEIENKAPDLWISYKNFLCFLWKIIGFYFRIIRRNMSVFFMQGYCLQESVGSYGF